MVPQVRFMGAPATPRPASHVVDRLAYRENDCRQSSSSMVRSRALIVPNKHILLNFLRGGGPGGGCDEKDRSFFNPNKYKVWQLVVSYQRNPLIVDRVPPFVGRLLGPERSWKVYSVRRQMQLL